MKGLTRTSSFLLKTSTTFLLEIWWVHNATGVMLPYVCLCRHCTQNKFKTEIRETQNSTQKRALTFYGKTESCGYSKKRASLSWFDLRIEGLSSLWLCESCMSVVCFFSVGGERNTGMDGGGDAELKRKEFENYRSCKINCQKTREGRTKLTGKLPGDFTNRVWMSTQENTSSVCCNYFSNQLENWQLFLSCTSAHCLTAPPQYLQSPLSNLCQ